MKDHKKDNPYTTFICEKIAQKVKDLKVENTNNEFTASFAVAVNKVVQIIENIKNE